MIRTAVAAVLAALVGLWVDGSPASAQQKKGSGASSACFSRCANKEEGYWPKTCQGNPACCQRNCNAPGTYGNRQR